MSARHVELRRGRYRDSVRLMQISRVLKEQPGVSAAQVTMATAVNLELLAEMGFSTPAGASPNDMLVAVAAADETALRSAMARLDTELDAGAGPSGASAGTVPSPLSVSSAVRRSAANLVLVSTPGRYAFLDAMDALDAGAWVMLFSDNVPVEQEVLLKRTARDRGLLVMGPDCGTAVVAGVGLGFANVVRPGPVGLVAASGTGAQQVMSLLDAADVGVSHCLGVGGRDLSAPVGGLSTVDAMEALDADPATELILVISKPPDPAVAERVRGHAASLSTPVRHALLGPDQPDLTAAVEGVLHALGAPVPGSWPCWLPAGEPPVRRVDNPALRGLFAGGTLCAEALVIAGAAVGTIADGLIAHGPIAHGPIAHGPIAHGPITGAPDRPAGSYVIDFGDDRLTAGRPHPIIDGGPRIERLAAEATDPSCAVVLLDVILGYAADPDPAATLGPAIAAARTRGPAVVVTLVGTAGDPQDLSRQAAALCDAGAAVFASNAAAARYAVECVRSAGSAR
jgi:FdrA protein